MLQSQPAISFRSKTAIGTCEKYFPGARAKDQIPDSAARTQHGELGVMPSDNDGQARFEPDGRGYWPEKGSNQGSRFEYFREKGSIEIEVAEYFL